MFILSKLAGTLLMPGNLAVAVLFAGTVMMFSRKVRWVRRGRRLTLAMVLGLFLVALTPLDRLLIAPLEQRFSQPLPLPATVDGIVVLGGAIDPAGSAQHHQVSLNAAAERMTALVELGRRYPDARLVFSGGSGSVLHPEAKEAPFARALLDQLGFDTHRVLFEGQSRNTWENAQFSRQMIMPETGQTWLLVTSAAHMPRAVGAFRAAGWAVVPYPVDYRCAKAGMGLDFSLAKGLSDLDAVAREWLGLVYYRLRGWSDALFPAPSLL